MQTLYIDVYFFVNFTTDLLAIYCAAYFSKIKSTPTRLISSALVAALFACVVVLLNLNSIVFCILIAATASLISWIFAYKALFMRRVKFFISFLVFETLIGGAVNFVFLQLDRILPKFFSEAQYSSTNRKFLVTSIIILLSYGIIKLLLLIFEGTESEKNAEVEICIFGKTETVCALVDSGNLLTDPFSGAPVIIAKRGKVNLLKAYGEILRSEDNEIKKRLRLIPAKGIGSEKILVGIRSDYVSLKNSKNRYNDIVIAIDEEEGSFGGYAALIPSSITDRH